MADINLREEATQLVEWGKRPALATRVSIPNVNLLSTKGSILYGTGNYSTATISGDTYQYAEVKALSGVGENDALIGKSVLLNDGSGNLSWTNVVDNLTTNDDSKVLSAKVGYDIDSKIHISEANGRGISIGYHSSSGTETVNIAIGDNATSSGIAGVSIGQASWATGINSTAIGNHANAFGDGCIAIGGAFYKSDTIYGDYAIAGTKGGKVYSAIQLGSGTNTTSYSFQVFDTPMLVNGKIPLSSLSPTITVDNKSGFVLSGFVDTDDIKQSYDKTVVLGGAAVATGLGGIAIGNDASAEENAIAIGSSASAKKGVVQLGNSDLSLAAYVGKELLMDEKGMIADSAINSWALHNITMFWRREATSVPDIITFQNLLKTKVAFSQDNLLQNFGINALKGFHCFTNNFTSTSVTTCSFCPASGYYKGNIILGIAPRYERRETGPSVFLAISILVMKDGIPQIVEIDNDDWEILQRSGFIYDTVKSTVNANLN